ncbi:MAG: MFS transporter [Bacilli bacterium]
MKYNLKQNELIYFIISFIFEFARTLPHAFVTIYLLRKGISLSSIALIQVSFMIAIILFEIPSGIFCDLYDKRIIYFISCLLMMLSYFLYTRAELILLVVIAQFIYGAASALQTGSIEMLLINKLHYHVKGKHLIEAFIRKNEIVNTSAMILGSLTGSLIFYYYKASFVYFIAIFLFSIVSVLTFLLTKEATLKDNNQEQKYSSHLKEGLHYVFTSKRLFLLVGMLALVQLIVQPYFNYWQPFVLQKHLDEKLLSTIYLLMQFISLIAAFAYKRYNKYLNFTILLIMLLVTIIIASQSPVLGLSIGFFLMNIIPRSFITIKLNSEIQNTIDNKYRSTITSFNSLFIRIFSILALIMTSLILKLGTSISLLFIISQFSFVVLFTFLYHNFSKIKNTH